jgi:hypothetical protein
MMGPITNRTSERKVMKRTTVRMSARRTLINEEEAVMIDSWRAKSVQYTQMSL